MCGRITRTSPRSVIAAEVGVAHFAGEELGPRYNVAPSQQLDVIVRAGDELRMGLMRWGFKESADARYAPINARSETVARARPFADAFRRRRCLIVADGFYEWRKQEGAPSQPHYIRLRSGAPFTFAGIWTFAEAPDGRHPTCALLTCPPNEVVAPIHDRMPVILAPTAREAWLAEQADPRELTALLRPYPPAEMDAWAVSTLVNSPRHDAPECLAPIH